MVIILLEKFSILYKSYNKALKILPKDPDFLLNKGNTLYYLN